MSTVRICNEKNWEVTHNISRLNNIETLPFGPRHNPVNHGDALGLFKERLSDNNLDITFEKGMLSIDELKYVYVAEINDKTIPDFALTVGFINFNNLKKAFTGLFGERVFVCSNEMFEGETINDNRRHTMNVWGKLTNKVDSIIERFKNFRETRIAEIDMMKGYEFTDSNVGNITLNMIRNHTLSNTDIARIVKEYDDPTYEDFRERTAWSFQNACTEVLKRVSDPSRRIYAANNIKNLINVELAA